MIDHTLTYDDVAQTWRGIVHDGLTLPRQKPALDQLMAGWSGQRESAMSYGATIAQMTDWVDNGRLAEGMRLQTGTPAAARPKLRFNDFDGELDVERLLDGDDRPYMLREKRKRTGGVTLRLQYNFRSNVDASVLADYAQWSAELIAGLQAKRFDLAIDVFSAVTMNKTVVKTNVRVKRFGKRSSLKSWGALFSPGGYRMLGFTARMMACAAHGMPCAPNMGVSIARGWGLSFDEKTRTLTVTCHAGGEAFPREEMNRKLAAVKL